MYTVSLITVDRRIFTETTVNRPAKRAIDGFEKTARENIILAEIRFSDKTLKQRTLFSALHEHDKCCI